MKQINTFYHIENQRDLNELIETLDLKFGILTPKYKDNPKNFPVLLTYAFTQDANGVWIVFKHITIEQIESLVTTLNSTP